MANEDRPVGYKQPRVQYRFQKRQSGKPNGRPKKKRVFLDDAAEIFGTPVTGHTNGKPVTMSTTKAVLRRLCRDALKANNAALRQVFDLMLTLKPKAGDQDEQNNKANFEARRKLMHMAGLDPDAIDDRPKAPNPKMEKLKKQADAMAKEEKKRLIREAKRRQQTR